MKFQKGMVDLSGGAPERINIKPTEAAAAALWSRLLEVEQKRWPLAFQ